MMKKAFTLQLDFDCDPGTTLEAACHATVAEMAKSQTFTFRVVDTETEEFITVATLQADGSFDDGDYVD